MGRIPLFRGLLRELSSLFLTASQGLLLVVIAQAAETMYFIKRDHNHSVIILER